MKTTKCNVCGEFHGSDFGAYLFLRKLNGITIPEKNWDICQKCSQEIKDIVKEWYLNKIKDKNNE